MDGDAQVRIGVVEQAAHLAFGQGLLLAVHLDVEFEAVGEHRVEGQDRVDAVGVLGVDDLLAALVERVGLETPQVEQVMAEVRFLLSAVDGGQQAFGLFLPELLPPQLEEQDAVVELGQHLADVIAEADRRRRLGVGAEPEVGVAPEDVDLIDHVLELAHDVEELRRRHRRPQGLALRLEVGDQLLEARGFARDEIFAGIRSSEMSQPDIS